MLDSYNAFVVQFPVDLFGYFCQFPLVFYASEMISNLLREFLDVFQSESFVVLFGLAIFLNCLFAVLMHLG
jgi:hypothetical protein